MPELPEVETIVRTLRPLITGQQVRRVLVCNAGSIDGSTPLQSLQGGQITHVDRRGKLVLIHAAGCSDPTVSGFAVHLRMTGRLFVYPAATPPEKHTRVVFDLAGDLGDLCLFFDDARKFGLVRVLTPQSLASWPFWNTLGPEPLEIDAQVFIDCFIGKRRGMKAMLLDQQCLAGVGNIYADESLFRAGIHPATKGNELTPQHLHKLYSALKDVLLESIDACGSSIKDYRTARGDAGAFQNAFRVYGRANLPCVHCGTPLQSTRIAGRGTVFCPACQPTTPVSVALF